jgi:hypothetical protein
MSAVSVSRAVLFLQSCEAVEARVSGVAILPEAFGEGAAKKVGGKPASGEAPILPSSVPARTSSTLTSRGREA